jgi:hypothetical protein
MKMKISFPFVLIILAVALAGSSIGAKGPDCAVGNFRFACPKNFKLVPLESTQGFSLFYWKKYDVVTLPCLGPVISRDFWVLG